MIQSQSKSHREALRRKLHIYRIVGSSLSAAVGIGAIAYLAALTGIPLLTPTFGATCFIIAVLPDSAFAQPRNVVGGHVLCSLVGLICLQLLGAYWWSYMVAVGLAIMVMQLTRALHPPAAANPLLIMMQPGISWNFLVTPVLTSTILLIFIAFLYHNVISKRSYPKYWL